MVTDIYIITPSFNASATIDSTIWSIVSQAGDFTLHYHIQDGGSTDGTVEKVRAWQARMPQLEDVLGRKLFFSWESAPDKGMYDAIQKGVSRFSMEPDSFMGWCNADDALLPGALQCLTEIARDIPEAKWLTGWATSYDNTGRFIKSNKKNRYPDAVIRGGLSDGSLWRFIQQESTFWKKSLWDAVGGINTELKLAGDWDLWVRFSKFASLLHVQRQLGSFWLRPGQLSANRSAYYKEIHSLVSEEEQQSNLDAILKNPAGNLHWQTVQKDDEGDSWYIRSHPLASAKVGVLAALYSACPTKAAKMSVFRILKKHLFKTIILDEQVPSDRICL